MPSRIDIQTGDRFGRFTIVREVERRAKKRYFLCKCDCGQTREVRFVALRAGAIVSCGCARDERNRTGPITHGLSGSGIYSSWHCMKQRCQNPKKAEYRFYGGRGITICDEWQTFEEFRDWALANGYQKGLTIERINVNGNYEPSNCTWIPKSQQSANTRRSLRNKQNAIPATI